jgi:hypothetical protein
VIDSLPALRDKLDMVEALLQVSESQRLSRRLGPAADAHPIDAMYASLGAELAPADKEEVEMVKQYAANTHGATHSLKVPGLSQAFNPCLSLMGWSAVGSLALSTAWMLDLHGSRRALKRQAEIASDRLRPAPRRVRRRACANTSASRPNSLPSLLQPAKRDSLLSSNLQIEIKEVLRVHREEEARKFRNDIENRKLLWHGSRLTNWAGIISQVGCMGWVASGGFASGSAHQRAVGFFSFATAVGLF